MIVSIDVSSDTKLEGETLNDPFSEEELDRAVERVLDSSPKPIGDIMLVVCWAEQLNMEFSPRMLLAVGTHGAKLCISCYEVPASLPEFHS